ncbi:hypothetical protein ACE939_11010 [Aquimarina sp. W85]|uniref:hypothetical protein n=1 Tax=Aquimarina rhodophyticola TaxID=3342246 RepID=UPI00366DAA82
MVKETKKKYNLYSSLGIIMKYINLIMVFGVTLIILLNIFLKLSIDSIPLLIFLGLLLLLYIRVISKFRNISFDKEKVYIENKEEVLFKDINSIENGKINYLNSNGDNFRIIIAYHFFKKEYQILKEFHFNTINNTK